MMMTKNNKKMMIWVMIFMRRRRRWWWWRWSSGGGGQVVMLVVGQWDGVGNMMIRSMMQQKSRSFSTSSSPTPKPKWLKADFAAIYIIAGFVALVGGIATHTGYQQLMNNPTVYFNKKRREMINEVENPMQAVNHGGRLVDSSFSRNVAHVQDKTKESLPNPIDTNIYTRSRHAETLESVKS